MKIVDGIIFWTTDEIIRPVLDRYGRQPRDQGIRDDILADLHGAVMSSDINCLRRYLTGEPSFWIGNLQSAYFQPFDGINTLDSYPAWAQAKCDLLLAVASMTRQDDFIIQHIVNYEDFHVEVLPFDFGPDFIVSLYELRGLDFFLFHYIGGETSAHEDDALFRHASCIVQALKCLGRVAESLAVEKEINLRKSRCAEILREWKQIGYDPSANLVGNMRIASERFWSDYLTPAVWTHLEPASRVELSDAFAMEYLLRREVLTSWSAATLALSKSVERELARALFIPWKHAFLAARWAPPTQASQTLRKKVDSRFLTFKTLQACATEHGHPPTLGQLHFLAKFWDDPTMNTCTDLFQWIRRELDGCYPWFREKVAAVAHTLDQPLLGRSSESVRLTEARNLAAHPREDSSVEWRELVDRLKAMLGAPPAELLKTITDLHLAGCAVREASRGAPVRGQADNTHVP